MTLRPWATGLRAATIAKVTLAPSILPLGFVPRGCLALGWVALCSLAVGCASKSRRDPDVETIRHVDHASPLVARASVPLAGERCGPGSSPNGPCRCRTPGVDDLEKEPPREGRKRFEIRMSADGGTAVLGAPALGTFETAGPTEVCFYVDVTAGTTNQFAWTAKADRPGEGVSPRLRVAEYGPKGPFWYDTFAADCVGSGGRCDRSGAERFANRTVEHRKRGRLDPCGSAVVSKLAWETSGGQADRDGGLYRDFTVRFAMEVKRFATQFAPGATECIPKDLPGGAK